MESGELFFRKQTVSFHFHPPKIILIEYQYLICFFEKYFDFTTHLFHFPGLSDKNHYQKEITKTTDQGTGRLHPKLRRVSKTFR